MRKPSSIPFVLVALVAMIIVGYENNAAFHIGAHTDAEQAHEAALQDVASHQAKSTPTAPQTAQPNPTSAPPTTAAITELTVGNPATAQTKITFGYTADEGIEQNPQTLNDFVNALQAYAKAQPNTSLQVECVDIPAADRADKTTALIPVGLAKNGRLIPRIPTAVGPAGLNPSVVALALH